MLCASIEQCLMFELLLNWIKLRVIGAWMSPLNALAHCIHMAYCKCSLISALPVEEFTQQVFFFPHSFFVLWGDSLPDQPSHWPAAKSIWVRFFGLRHASYWFNHGNNSSSLFTNDTNETYFITLSSLSSSSSASASALASRKTRQCQGCSKMWLCLCLTTDG